MTLAASYAEGFGLPLVEAARFGIPIIARDIPVFREVAGEHAFYFSGNSAADLASRLSVWVGKYQRSEVPQSKNMPWLTWSDSARQLMDVISNRHWTFDWMREDGFRYRGSSPSLLTQVGEKKGGNVKTTGQAGALFFGPFAPLPSGQYEVRLWGKVQALGGAKLDVCIEKGATILAEVALPKQTKSPDQGEIMPPLILSLSRPCKDLEVRLWVTEKSDIVVSRLDIALHNDGNGQAEGLSASTPSIVAESMA